MRRLANTSISLFFGLMMLHTFGAGCTAFVEVGDDSGDGGGQEAGPDDDAHGTGSGGGVIAEGGSSVGSGGGVSAEVGSSVGSGGGVSAEVGSSVGSGGGVSAEVGSSVGSGGGVSAEVGSSVGSGGNSSTGGGSPVGSGGNSGTGGGPSVGSGSTGSGSASETVGAIALLGSQLPDRPDDPWSSSATGGGPPHDPDDLFVIIGPPVRSCAAPNAALECGDWRVSFRIPPTLQVPGIIDFSDENFYLISLYAVNGPDRGDGDCSRLGGLFTSGTLEIVSIDAANVVVRLSGTETDHFDASGEYTAPRCP
ncbi:hypothetical protein [Sorangium sp. So ce341]|uniref:hypothetical protein n=1 Tax=Sorangium sp. So ce341 TaxID=3133302 RepID=UPI003F61C72D